MRDGRIVDVDAADGDHARKVAAQQVGTAYPGVQAERLESPIERMQREESSGLSGVHATHVSSGQLNARKPRSFRVTFKDGTSETVTADSLDEAWSKARRSGRKQISVGHQGRKVVADVQREL